MSSRSLNKVTLIGNLTRDPELRFTPQGTAVCTFGLATNRSWTTDSGEKREETEFHRIVSWNKLAELCSQLLAKGRKVYVEGRLQTRNWNGSDGVQHTTTEIVIEDMIILDSKRIISEVATSEPVASVPISAPTDASATAAPPASTAIADDKKTDDKTKADDKKKDEEKNKTEKKDEAGTEDINPDDIPF